MRTITITIETENDAFADHPGGEIARILRKTADQFDNQETVLTSLMDHNGNKVGEMVVVDA